jgi:hypothetical protein
MSAVELPSVAPRFPTRIAGWHLPLTGDYAEPATAGGGYIEVQDDGTVEVAYESNSAEREMGLPTFLLTRVPVEVLRALVEAWDAKRAAPSPAPNAERSATDRLVLVEQLTSAVEHVNAGMASTSPDDSLAFAELASALRESADVADMLAVDGGAS